MLHPLKSFMLHTVNPFMLQKPVQTGVRQLVFIILHSQGKKGCILESEDFFKKMKKKGKVKEKDIPLSS